MADDVKADDFTDELRRRFAQSISRGVGGIPAHHALQLADVLCMVQADVLAGKRVTFKVQPECDGEAIAEDWHCGLSLAEIMRKHGISKATAYRHHPNRRAPGKMRRE